MKKNYQILDKLKLLIKENNKYKSSHWNTHLKNIDLNNVFKNNHYGSFEINNLYKNIFNKIFTFLIFEKKIFFSNVYKKYKSLFNKMNRAIDCDAMRHILTYNLLKKNLQNKKIKNICIIGDGRINGLIGAKCIFPDSRIFSINLPEILINDYLILNKYRIIKNKNIQLINKVNDKIINKKKLILITPSKKKFLLNKEIDLFINIASFQEMPLGEIKKYFAIIKKNSTYLYCANREYKKLYGGEVLEFNKYPFGNGKIILYEDCKWHKKFYSPKPFFIHNYDGNIKHCLIKYN
jgi:hypothetical protein